jgi:hypothetical protein
MMNGGHILECFPTAAAAATRQVASKLKKNKNMAFGLSTINVLSLLLPWTASRISRTIAMMSDSKSPWQGGHDGGTMLPLPLNQVAFAAY